MPSINIKQVTYEDLHKIMAHELFKKTKGIDPKKVLLEVIKTKYGVTSDFVISKMIAQYKQKHKIT